MTNTTSTVFAIRYSTNTTVSICFLYSFILHVPVFVWEAFGKVLVFLFFCCVTISLTCFLDLTQVNVVKSPRVCQSTVITFDFCAQVPLMKVSQISGWSPSADQSPSKMLQYLIREPSRPRNTWPQPGFPWGRPRLRLSVS